MSVLPFDAVRSRALRRQTARAACRTASRSASSESAPIAPRAPVGQAATQLPQLVHASASMRGRAGSGMPRTPCVPAASSRSNDTASMGHASKHAVQSSGRPRCARQRSSCSKAAAGCSMARWARSIRSGILPPLPVSGLQRTRWFILRRALLVVLQLFRTGGTYPCRPIRPLSTARRSMPRTEPHNDDPAHRVRRCDCGHVRARDEHERARDKRASGEAMTSRHTFLSSLGVAQLSARGS